MNNNTAVSLNNLSTRYMTIQLTLSTGVFDGSGGTSNIKIITANSGQGYLDAECVITKAIGFLSNTAYINISGMLMEDINTFTRANLDGNQSLYTDNNIDIYAGYTLNSDSGLPPLIYSGQIRLAGANFNNPSRQFSIISMQTNISQNLPVLPTNPKGDIAVDDLLRNLCNQVGIVYRGKNVTGTVTNPIFISDFETQVREICQQYQLHYNNDNNKILYVAPINQPFSDEVYTLNAQNGMLGYPIIEEYGISVRLRFNPSITIGQQIEIQSQYNYANRIWFINAIEHVLQNKRDKWETILKLNTFFFAAT